MNNFFDDIIDKTLGFEGSYQCHPEDDANYYHGVLLGTMCGISASAYGTYLGRMPTIAEMKAITPAIAKKVYKKLFWDRLLLDNIKSKGVAWIIFQYYIGDGNVIHLRRAIEEYLESVGNTASFSQGNVPFTPYSINLINSLDPEDLFIYLKTYRMNRYDKIVKASPKSAKFLNGWRNRLNKIVYS